MKVTPEIIIHLKDRGGHEFYSYPAFETPRIDELISIPFGTHKVLTVERWHTIVKGVLEHHSSVYIDYDSK